jgi:SlyX protein
MAGAMTDDRTAILEERLTHLTVAHEELSDVVARQSREIDRLTRSMQRLLEREAERAMDTGVGPAADQKPPHW